MMGRCWQVLSIRHWMHNRIPGRTLYLGLSRADAIPGPTVYTSFLGSHK